MKFVRIFALLIALLAVIGGLKDIATLAVVDSYNESEAFWLALVDVAVGLGFGVGAYFLTKREDA